jgi:hypothetical protein
MPTAGEEFIAVVNSVTRVLVASNYFGRTPRWVYLPLTEAGAL